MRRTAIALLALLLLPLQPQVAWAQATEDPDGDGLTNSQEDANANGVLDAGETDPMRADTDAGGEADGSEVRAGRNPRNASDDFTADPDGDGLSNGREAALGTDPAKADTDGDGVNDAQDPFPTEKAFKEDADRDGIADEWERQHALNAAAQDDGDADNDGDGLRNREEFIFNTNPAAADTDRDGVPDAQEIADGTDPEESACLSSGESMTFVDSANHWATPYIHALAQTRSFESPIIRGYGSGGTTRFIPDRSITRFELLKIALLSACIALQDVPTAPFPDVTDGPTDAALRRRVIGTAKNLGIVRGYQDGTFRPDATVTRAEALLMLLAASQIQRTAPLESTSQWTFPDVQDTDWFGAAVGQAVGYGIIVGYDDGTFRPHASITRAETAKIALLLLLGNPTVNSDVLPPLL